MTLQMPDAFDWDTLLPEAHTVQSVDLRPFLEGQTVLITGAGGYIGSALAHACAAQGASHVVLLDIAEGGLYTTDRALRERERLRMTTLLGSAGDRTLLHAIFRHHAPGLVFHAGAYKHVPLAEANPCAVVQNNTLATASLAAVCAQQAGTQLIMVSTDKAVEPAGIMGASKRLGEIALACTAHAASGTIQRAVRLGNVLGSPGSVGPLFLEQAQAGLPLTVTHPQALRYFVSLRRTTQFLLAACAAPPSATLLVPELEAPVRVVDLAHRIRAGRDNPILFTGLRPGEKLVEAMLGEEEMLLGEAPGGLHAVQTLHLAPSQLQQCLAQLAGAIGQHDTDRLVAAVQLAIPGFRRQQAHA